MTPLILPTLSQEHLRDSEVFLKTGDKPDSKPTTTPKEVQQFTEEGLALIKALNKENQQHNRPFSAELNSLKVSTLKILNLPDSYDQTTRLL